MPCYCPLTAYYSRDIGKSGRRGITFDRRMSLSGSPLQLPCGQCVGCRLERSRQWAMRCLHEKKMSKCSCFVTLTYADENLPHGGTLVKRDLQLFMKRLRKAKGDGIRFYACGEYGDENKRPHYHVLLFNVDFRDKKESGTNGRGDKYYRSADLDGIWGLGRTLVADVSFDSAAYVARYVMKKVVGAEAYLHYEVFNIDTGEIVDREPEFTVMSRRPGIGATYYDKYGKEVRDLDNVIINGREVRPPRFYDTRFRELDERLFDVVKRRRRRMALLFRDDNTPDRRRVKEVLTLKLLKQKVRAL